MGKIENPKHLKNLEKKINREQRRLSRKQKKSKNYDKQLQKLAKLYEKLKNRREDFLHKLSKRIISENQAIILEDLDIKNLAKNKIAKHIYDASWRKFIDYLSYKSILHNRKLIFVNRFYASSKTCSVCGHKNESLKLEHREWVCVKCNAKHDRDINAAINLLKEAIKQVGQGLPELTTVERWTSACEMSNHPHVSPLDEAVSFTRAKCEAAHSRNWGLCG